MNSSQEPMPIAMPIAMPPIHENAGLITGITLVSVFVLIFLITFWIFYFRKTTDSMFNRLAGFYKGSLGQIQVGLIVAILISGVIMSFNGLIMTPLVQVAIPNQTVFKKGVDIGRGVWAYPGQFAINLFGFIVSLFIIFCIFEGSFQMSRAFGEGWYMFLTIFFMIIVCLVIILLIVWNFISAIDPSQLENTPFADTPPTVGAASAMTTPVSPTNAFINSMGGVGFTF